jgi:hypothetical protein
MPTRGDLILDRIPSFRGSWKDLEMKLLQWLKDWADRRQISNMRKEFAQRPRTGPYIGHTHFQLMKVMVPDIEERLDRLQTEDPELLKEIDYRQGSWFPKGFQPFACFNGFD